MASRKSKPQPDVLAGWLTALEAEMRNVGASNRPIHNATLGMLVKQTVEALADRLQLDELGRGPGEVGYGQPLTAREQDMLDQDREESEAA